MLYAVPQHTTDSLKLMKMVLQLIASHQEVSSDLKSRVYQVIREASSINSEHEKSLHIPTFRESISLAVEMQHTHALAEALTVVTSEEMLEPNFARYVLEHI
ncbi:hypothetical protein DMB99_17040 [Proteus mirabilis]|uniref:hypothetical protein n=1 Tax=Proteus mirabilis TaxID=584 RepID=UPI000D7296D4|nr:hypothetical protein [Proteus mirabilis]EKW2646119.1 hypothetical protein [Proteus mirabilis]ELA7721641.1 hypothetical protein [Proteus mirabilis]ELA9909251.1 hypothetical protein [Proteus mirabilis]MDC9764277.1 hypothetical protein [Proteus mirabilis]PXA24121.1 hypothetical protein DMB99_17040 [Proteus mirabilis]